MRNAKFTNRRTAVFQVLRVYFYFYFYFYFYNKTYFLFLTFVGV